MNEIFGKIDRLLALEEEALLSGKLGALEDLAAKKSEAFRALREGENLEPGLLRPLRRRSQRNQQLYHAALAGLRLAAKRIQAVKDSQKGFSIYTRDGQSQTLHSTLRARSQTV